MTASRCVPAAPVCADGHSSACNPWLWRRLGMRSVDRALILIVVSYLSVSLLSSCLLLVYSSRRFTVGMVGHGLRSKVDQVVKYFLLLWFVRLRRCCPRTSSFSVPVASFEQPSAQIGRKRSSTLGAVGCRRRLAGQYDVFSCCMMSVRAAAVLAPRPTSPLNNRGHIRSD